MPDSDPAAVAALHALGFALFVRESPGVLRLAGSPPLWLRKLWPEVTANGAALPAGESPFLENFLIDAESCWSAGTTRVRSGPWVERDITGEELPLEATALQADDRALLLVERLGEDFQAKSRVLQTARENVISYQMLNAELLKKEILLHCVAEDMTASLANAITALRLIELEQDPTKTRLLQGLASRALEEQQSLIHKVLDVFADDLDSFYGRHGGAPAHADLRAAVQAARDELGPRFAEKGVRLVGPEYVGGPLFIAADAAHLQRVVANLLENALHATPEGLEVTLELEDDGDEATLRVGDGGEPSDYSIPTQLFVRIAPVDPQSEPSLLRLHFCRIAVENCGGEIGCGPRPGGGNCYWIRVPKAPRAS